MAKKYHWTRTQLKALKGSILKWEKILLGTGKEDGQANCPCCIKYLERDCKGCPIAKATGEALCEDTPYRVEWAEEGYPNYARTDAEVVAARHELDFLRSLLD